MNPRYIAYCIANGESDPEKQFAKDMEQYPGGCMCGFILWIQSKWNEWQKENKTFAPGDSRVPSDTDHVLFDEWLSAKK